jgi:transcriptional regulator
VAGQNAPLSHAPAQPLQTHPLATLVTLEADGTPQADLIPLQWHPAGDHGFLRGHVARANPLWQRAQGQTVLALFHGPQGYVSPGWYPSKIEHGKGVPTWNYTVVQARGQLRTLEDPEDLRPLLAELTAPQEALQSHAPWRLEESPADYLAAMLRAIVGIEIAVTELVGKWKLSQNRTDTDRQGVIQGLQARPEASAQALARCMRGD